MIFLGPSDLQRSGLSDIAFLTEWKKQINPPRYCNFSIPNWRGDGATPTAEAPGMTGMVEIDEEIETGLQKQTFSWRLLERSNLLRENLIRLVKN